MSSHDLFREVYGYNARSNIPERREEPVQLRNSKRFTAHCPHRNGPCNKSTSTDSELGMSRALGVCSATANDGTPVITCPERFLTEGVRDDLQAFFFGETDYTVKFETEVAMGDVGRIDVTAMLLDKREIKDIVSIEIQTSYFSGGEIRTPFKEYMEPVNKGESPTVPQDTRDIDYRSCIDKRLLPQLQQKVEVMKEHDHATAAVVQDVSYENSVVLSRVDRVPEADADMFWFIYEYTEADPMYALECTDIIPTRIEDIRDAIKNVNMSEYDEYLANLENRIVSTDGGADDAYTHDGSYQERLNLWV